MSPAEIFSQPPSIFSQPASQAVTLALVHFIWQGALIAALLVAVVELLRIRRPQARYACSLVALLLMAACPLGTVAWQGIRSQESGVGSQADDNGPTTEEIAETTTHYSPLTTHTVLSSAQPYLLAAWLAGVGFFGCRLLGGLVGLRRLRRGALPLVGELGHRVDRLGERLGMKARSLVRLSTRVSEAMAVGLLRPIVLIPAAWVTEMPPAMLEAVIAHELAHLRRQDLWINLLQRVVETLLFYHPAVWWLSRRLRAERELCCDELAVAATGRRLEYVQALEHVARQQVALVEPLLAAGIRGERNMRLLQRVRNVLGLSAASDRSLWPAGLLALALPLGAWAYTSGLISGDAAVVVADDDKDDDDDKDNDKDEAKEEREEKEVRKDADREKERDDDEEREVRKEKDREEGRKEGDKERDNPEAAARKRERIEQLKFLGREEEARRDGDRPVKEGARDGEKPVKEGARDGDRPAKKVIARDGEERVVEGTVRRIVRKDGDREEVVIEEIRGKKEAVEDMAARMNELLSMVKRLSMENERLKAELAEIRGNKEREGFYRVREKEAAAVEKEFAIKEKEGAAREKEAAIKAKEGAAREKEAAAKEREGAIREKEAAARRAVAEKQEAIARERKEGAARKEAELRERKSKEDIEAYRRELIERKKAEAAEREKKEGEEKRDE